MMHGNKIGTWPMAINNIIGLFQKVKIHPHGSLLINLDGFMAKILSPDGLATALNLTDS